MMSFSQIKSAGGAAGYYSDKDNYYVLGSLESKWIGKGAEELGLSGHVDNLALTEVLHGKLPDGTSLSRMQDGKETHRPGYDLTFSAPKSVSMMALIGDDRRFIEAHNRAVATAMTEVEGLASARVTEDKVTRTQLTGNMVAALFNHDTSRDLDPQIHTHALVINATRTEDGWRALSSDTKGKTGFSETVLASQVALGNIYRVALRKDVEEMGFTTHTSGKNGLWELDNVPVEVFSRRNDAIKAAAGDDASLKSRDVATLDTRKSKVASDPAVLVSEWKSRLQETGFDMAAYREQADFNTVKHTLASDGVASGKADPAAGAVNPENDTITVKDAVGKAISLLSDNKVQFSYSDVLAKTVGQLPAEPGIFQSARDGIDAAIEQQRLIPLDKEKGIFTSDIHLLNELSIHAMVKDIKEGSRVTTFPENAEARNTPWSDAMAVMAQDRPPVAVMSGAGGAGANRDRIAEVITMAKEMGREVTVLSADRRSDVWLNQDERITGHTMTKSGLSADLVLPPQSTFVVDQAEKLTLKETLLILEQGRNHDVQVVFMDTEKRKGTGSALTVLSEADVPLYRYRGGTQADVNVISVGDKRTRFDRLAQDYAQLDDEGVSVVAQVNGAKEQQLLTGAIRQQLQQEGRLGAETTVNTLTPVWLDNKSRGQRDSYREGMVMEQWDSEKKAMTRYTIDRVTDLSNTLTLKNADGDTITEKVNRLDSSWSLYKPQTLALAEGDRVTALGREMKGQIKARDEMTVLGVSADGIDVQLKGKTLTLDPSQPLKLAHNYVESLGASVDNGQTVLAATTPKEMTQAGLNQLARSGGKISLYTAMAEDKATARLEGNPYFRLASEQVKQLAGDERLDSAMLKQRDGLYGRAELAVRLGTGIAQQKSSNGMTFSKPQLLDASLGVNAGLNVTAIGTEIERQVKKGDLISVEAVHGVGSGLMIPRAAYDMEKSIIRNIAEGKNAVEPLMNHVPESSLTGLTPGQQDATRLILESPDRFLAIQGYAGVGKTTQLRAVMSALDTLPPAERPEVVGIGPTHRAVNEMISVGVKAQTLASFLAEERQLNNDGQVARHEGKLFLIDESSMTGNRDMAEAYQLIATGGGRAVSSGDRDQLSAIDSGAPFTLQQQRSAVDVAIMKDIVRQTPELKPAIYSMIEGNYGQALEQVTAVAPAVVARKERAWVPDSSVMEFIKEEKDKEASQQPVVADEKSGEQGPASIRDAIVADYTGRVASARDDTLVIVKLNDDRRYINAEIHAALKESDELGEKEQDFTVLTQVATQRDEMRSAGAWATHKGKMAFVDNTFYQIDSVDKKAGTVMLTSGDGETRILSSFENSTRDASVWEKSSITLSPGDKVRFSATDNERGYVANSTWKVEDMDGAGHLWLRSGDQVKKLAPGTDLYESRIDLAYAVTTHGAQGASERYGITLEATEGARKHMLSRESSYVALSRAKEHIQVYTDDREKWVSQLENSAAKLTAHDIVHAKGDRDSDIAAQLLGWAKPMADTGLGRSLLRNEGLEGEFRGSFVSPGKKYPAPHMALPVYDSHGRQAGAYLDELLRDDKGIRFSGNPRLIGSEDARFAALQQSQNGDVQIVKSLTDGLNTARENPETGVLIRLSGEGEPLNMNRVMGGVNLRNVTEATQNDARNGDPLPFIKDEDERRQQELEKRQEEAARKVSGDERDAVRNVANAEVSTAGEKELPLQVPEKEAVRSIAVVTQVAMENNIMERMKQIERDLVKENMLGE